MVFTSFTSPIKQANGWVAYLESTKRFHDGAITFEVRYLPVDGEKACALTQYQLQRPGMPAFESDVAEVFRCATARSPRSTSISTARLSRSK